VGFLHRLIYLIGQRENNNNNKTLHVRKSGFVAAALRELGVALVQGVFFLSGRRLGLLAGMMGCGFMPGAGRPTGNRDKWLSVFCLCFAMRVFFCVLRFCVLCATTCSGLDLSGLISRFFCMISGLSH
jgi:hypothetical protein